MLQNREPSGAILIDKKANITSFNSLNDLKKILKTKKIGHCGTLDSFATGLLVALVGNLTKFASFVEASTKEYFGSGVCGKTTSTLDLTSEIIKTANIPDFEEVLDALPIFKNNIMQRPPLYSAIKIGGVRSSDLVRSGKEVNIEPREVTIYDFQISSYDKSSGTFDFYVKCSKGTYVRSLISDLFESLNSCAYLTSLRRTQIGAFKIENAISISRENQNVTLLDEKEFFSLLKNFTIINIDQSLLSKLKYGKEICLSDFNELSLLNLGQNHLALFYNNQFAAALKNCGKTFNYIYNGAPNWR